MQTHLKSWQHWLVLGILMLVLTAMSAGRIRRTGAPVAVHRGRRSVVGRSIASAEERHNEKLSKSGELASGLKSYRSLKTSRSPSSHLFQLFGVASSSHFDF